MQSERGDNGGGEDEGTDERGGEGKGVEEWVLAAPGPFNEAFASMPERDVRRPLLRAIRQQQREAADNAGVTLPQDPALRKRFLLVLGLGEEWEREADPYQGQFKRHGLVVRTQLVVCMLEAQEVWRRRWHAKVKKCAADARRLVSSTIHDHVNPWQQRHTRLLNGERDRVVAYAHCMLYTTQALIQTLQTLTNVQRHHSSHLHSLELLAGLVSKVEGAIAASHSWYRPKARFEFPSRGSLDKGKANIVMHATRVLRPMPVGLVEAVRRAKALKTKARGGQLDLKYIPLGAHGLQALSPLIADLTHITGLLLHRTGCGDDGAIALSQSIACLPNLRILWLAENGIGGRGAVALSECIGRLANLSRLNLDNNAIGDVGLGALGPEIGKLKNLEVLSLQENKVTSRGAVPFMPEVAKLTKLKHLMLTKNMLEGEGAMALSECLGHLDNLSHLGLGDTLIGDRGLRAVEPALVQLPNLEWLTLNGNNITDQAAVDLAPSITKLVKLSALWLHGNQLEASGKEVVRAALPPRCKLCLL